MEPFRLVQVSDLHFRKHYGDWGVQKLLGGLPDPLGRLRECLETEKKAGLDLVLLTGDLSHDGTAEDYAALRDALNAALGGLPWIALPGNHDDRRGMLEAGIVPSVESVSYEVDGWRVLTLDTGAGSSGVIGGRQAAWLREVLSRPSARGSLLAVHHPLLPDQGGLGTMRMDPALPEILAQSDVAGIFCGHTHRNLFSTFAGKPYFTADSLSYTIEQAGPETCLRAAAGYTRAVFSEDSFFAQVKRLVPASAAASCFPTDRLSTLFRKESEETK